jgi:hypothetical protein
MPHDKATPMPEITKLLRAADGFSDPAAVSL